MFAYYTNTTDYSFTQITLKPNFMYNQKVEADATTGDGSSEGDKFSVSTWKYSPIKYWPNDFDDSSVDTQVPAAEGTQDNGGKVSFFAYGPYVDFTGIGTAAATDITGLNNNTDKDIEKENVKTVESYSTATGIIARTINTYEGHPYLQYRLKDIKNYAENVDLLWGTTGTLGEKAVGGSQSGSTLDTYGKGAVNLNLTKMKTGGKVGFNFKHALALVGGKNTSTTSTPNGLTIQLDPDNTTVETATIGGTAGLPTTKVTVTSIIITNDTDASGNLGGTGEGIAVDGVFNLATGEWKLGTESTDASYVFTQTIDGTGASDNFILNADIAEDGVDVSTPAKVTAYFKNTDKPGVTTDKKPVYGTSDEANPLIFIPGTTPKLKFTITYTVRTYDEALETYKSEVVQTISRVVTFGAPVELNKRYNINILLGLTTIKFDATVSPWDVVTDLDGDGTLDEVDDQVHLPLNVE